MATPISGLLSRARIRFAARSLAMVWLWIGAAWVASTSPSRRPCPRRLLLVGVDVQAGDELGVVQRCSRCAELGRDTVPFGPGPADPNASLLDGRGRLSSWAQGRYRSRSEWVAARQAGGCARLCPP
jgi:hypothetical protein